MAFRCDFIRSYRTCLQASLNQGTLGSLVLETWDLGMVLFAISIKLLVN